MSEMETQDVEVKPPVEKRARFSKNKKKNWGKVKKFCRKIHKMVKSNQNIMSDFSLTKPKLMKRWKIKEGMKFFMVPRT